MGQAERRHLANNNSHGRTTTAKEAVIIPNSIFMPAGRVGDSRHNFEPGYKPAPKRKRSIYGIISSNLNTTIKRLKEMEAAKLVSVLFYFFGVPLAGIAAWLNIGTWKADAIFIVGFLLLVARLIWFIVEKIQRYRMNELNIKKRKQDIEDE